ncbi:hypothetical protein HK101_002230 [Irineochytrium annulatum]|nr:hypothetical protein HK101_002230 [Irineochytrium annulatum]
MSTTPLSTSKGEGTPTLSPSSGGVGGLRSTVTGVPGLVNPTRGTATFSTTLAEPTVVTPEAATPVTTTAKTTRAPEAATPAAATPAPATPAATTPAPATPAAATPELIPTSALVFPPVPATITISPTPISTWAEAYNILDALSRVQPNTQQSAGMNPETLAKVRQIAWPNVLAPIHALLLQGQPTDPSLIIFAGGELANLGTLTWPANSLGWNVDWAGFGLYIYTYWSAVTYVDACSPKLTASASASAGLPSVPLTFPAGGSVDLKAVGQAMAVIQAMGAVSFAGDTAITPEWQHFLQTYPWSSTVSLMGQLFSASPAADQDGTLVSYVNGLLELTVRLPWDKVSAGLAGSGASQGAAAIKAFELVDWAGFSTLVLTHWGSVVYGKNC